MLLLQRLKPLYFEVQFMTHPYHNVAAICPRTRVLGAGPELCNMGAGLLL